MAESNQLNTAWLARLTNPHHDGTTQQIDDIVAKFVTDNNKLKEKVTTLHQCRQQEDDVWQKSQRDPVVKQLEIADKRQDNYIVATRYIIMAYASLPDTETTKLQAMQCDQVFKDFDLRTNEAYGAEADKILQMGDRLRAQEAFLTEVGAWAFYQKAAEAAREVRDLLSERAKTKGEYVKSEMKDARRATDMAVADLYKMLMAMQELLPTDELTALVSQLKGVEIYARQYYIDKPTKSDEEEAKTDK